MDKISQGRAFGSVTSGSTNRTINIIVRNPEGEGVSALPAVGRMVYLDYEIDHVLYRALGTITEMVTTTPGKTGMTDLFSARPDIEMSRLPIQDLRLSSFNIQATFKRVDNDWVQASSVLPASPSTQSAVRFLDAANVREIEESAAKGQGVYPTVGYFKGMENVPQPFMIPDFGGAVGAKSTGILGRSGSGKTSFYSLVLSGAMQHEHHAIIVIDPQGQWSNENGVIFSPQKFAQGLGREVHVIRMSEDVRLNADEEIISRMIDKLDVWRKGFRRMGAENLANFSEEVVSRLVRNRDNFDLEPRVVLSGIFRDIVERPSSLARIYASLDNQTRFANELRMLAGMDPEPNAEGVIPIVTDAEKEDADESWERMNTYFRPLFNLFSSKNMSGGRRRPFGGEKGVLSNILKVRKKGDAPAPYVVFDMSPDVTLHAKAALLNGSDPSMSMQKILDNQDVKALILMMMLEEMKRASEVAFSSGGGNLNTQIVFDEAWRFAPPDGQGSQEIRQLSDMLEGFALDTRKFGIGWTYILQSPSDLRKGIWRQLSYVYAGYGLVGDDVKALETLTDDVRQIDLYRQFIPPASTGQYPFMVLGPISPIIFTTAPAFVNAFNTPAEFLDANATWIEGITRSRSLPALTNEYMTGARTRPAREVVTEAQESVAPASYKVGKSAAGKPDSAPQSVRVKAPAPVVEKKDDGLDEFPF